MSKLLKIAIAVCCFISNFQANQLNVPIDYSTIQSAINSATDGDTVIVAEGTYYENIRFYGKGILVGSTFVLDGNSEHILKTIIDGSKPTQSDTASCVLFIDDEDSTSIIEGFTITGGTGTAWEDEHGAGLYYEGGGILTAFSAPVIRHNIIRDNKAARVKSGATSAGGGGIRCGDGNTTIIGNIIINNKGLYGGGIVMNYTKGTIKNNIVVNNEVNDFKSTPFAPDHITFGGGGIWINSGGPNLVVNNTIVANSSAGGGSTWAGFGGGIFSAGIAVIKNNIVWANTQENGSQIRKSGTDIITEYNNVEDGIDGNGNISLEPMFSNENYLLTEESPCIDMGDPSEEYNDPAEGNSAIFPSLGSERNDIGAYGGPLSSIFPSNVILDINDREVKNFSFSLEQNYPNPFNPTTSIEYQVSANENVTLKVYDLLGNEIITLVNEQKSPGIYETSFDASQLSSGVYFYKLNNGGYTQTKKMLLLK